MKWTGEEDDWLLDLWFAGYGYNYISARVNNRTAASLEGRFWKLCTGYQLCRGYTHSIFRRSQRTGPLTRREIAALELGLFGEGQNVIPKRKIAVDAEHMALILNRPLSVVYEYIEKRKPVQPGFGL